MSQLQSIHSMGVLLCVAVATSTSAQADRKPMRLCDAIGQSDLIVVGVLAEAHLSADDKYVNGQGTIMAEHVIPTSDGPPSVVTHWRYYRPRSEQVNYAWLVGQRSVWFLKWNPDHTVVAVDPGFVLDLEDVRGLESRVSELNCDDERATALVRWLRERRLISPPS